MGKKIGKLTVLAVIAALFVFAFACTAFAEETDDTQDVQPVQLDGPELPVGGWEPAEAIYVPENLVVAGSEKEDGIKSSKNKINADPDDVFVSGAATTGYEALNSKQKQVYTEMNAKAVKFMNAEEDLQPTTVSMGGVDQQRYIVDMINYKEKGINNDQEALKVFYAFQYDHPGYYWLSNEVLYNSENIYPCTEPEYAGVNERQEINTLIINSVKAYADIAKAGTDTLDKIALVHDKIVNDIDYAYKDNDGSTPEPAKWAHSVHGVFDPKYKKAVCEGYADAFALIMNYMNIRNYFIVGDAGEGGSGGNSGHAWNAVYDASVEHYFYMDLTWDDIGKDENGDDAGYSYAYFGMPQTAFEETHFAYKSDATVAGKWLYPIKGEFYNDDEYTYYKLGGLYYDIQSDDDLQNFAVDAKAKATRAGGWVSVLCPLNGSTNEIARELGVNHAYYPLSYNGVKYGIITASLGEKHYDKNVHAWTEPAYIWAADSSKVTAIRICKAPNCGVITEMETANFTMTDNTATCTAAGQATYSAEFHNAAFSVPPKIVTMNALGHKWNAPTYQWASDYSAVTAKRVCARDGYTESETAKATSKITRAATYSAKGQRTYTAVFQNPIFRTQAKTVANVPMLAKKANTMKVKAITRSVKLKTLKKKALTVTPLKISYAKGTVRYKRVSGNAKSKKALTLNTKTGKVTVKKKTKKGKYQIKVKVTAGGTVAYKALSKNVLITVIVK